MDTRPLLESVLQWSFGPTIQPRWSLILCFWSFGRKAVSGIDLLLRDLSKVEPSTSKVSREKMLGIKSQHHLKRLGRPFFSKGALLSTCLSFAGMHFRNSFAYIFAYLAAKTFLKYISMEKETYVSYGEQVEDTIQLIRRFSLSQSVTSSDVLGTHNSQNSKTPWEFWEMSLFPAHFKASRKC